MKKSFTLRSLWLWLMLMVVGGVNAAPTIEAKIGTTEYATLAEALAAATTGQTVELLQDATISSTLTVKDGVTLYGGLHTVTANYSTAFCMGNNTALRKLTIDQTAATAAWNGVSLKDDGNNVTLSGLKALGSATKQKPNVAFLTFNYANLTLENCEIKNFMYWLYTNGTQSNINCSNCKFSDASYGIFLGSTTDGVGGNTGIVSFENCEFSGAKIQIASYKEMSYTDCVIDGTCVALGVSKVATDGKAVMSGCNFLGAANISYKYSYADVADTYNLEDNYWGGTAKPDVNGGATNSGYYPKAEIEGAYSTANPLAVANPAAGIKVAQIGTKKYATLAEAVAAAQAGDEIILLADQEISAAIEISKNLTLNLNGYTITNNVASNRLFRVGGVTFTVNGTVNGSSMIIPETNKYSFGFVDMRNIAGTASADAKLVLNGGYYEGATLGGAFFKGRTNYQTFELNDVHCKCTAGDGQQYYANGYFYNGDNASVVNAHSGSYPYLTTLKVNGGLYEHNTLAITAPNVFQGRNFMTDDKPSVSFDDVKVVSSHGPVYELSAGEMTINNCDFTIEGAITWQNSALCASNNAELNVNGGKYKAPYAVYALTSGATINLNGGEYIASKSLLVAGTEDSYPAAVSTINVYDGTFEYTGSAPAEAFQTYGNRPTEIAVSGGTFSLEIPEQYCEEGFAPTANGDGTYGVKAVLVADTEGIYSINTPADLVTFSSMVNDGNNFAGKTVKLAADIDMDGIAFTPIAQSANWFAGVFDGQNHTIKNLTVNTPTTIRAALFGGLSHGTVKNFTLDNPTIQGGDDYTAAVCASGNGTIDNVTVKGGTVKGKDQVGGIAGFMIATTIKNCTLDGTEIEATGDRAGGIIGKIDGQNSFTIDNNTLKAVIVKAAAKHGVCGAAGIASQFMTNTVSSGMSVKDNDIDVTTITAGVEEFMPIGNVREGCSMDPVNETNISGNHWLPETIASTTVSNGTTSVTFSNCIPLTLIYQGGSPIYKNSTTGYEIEDNGNVQSVKIPKDYAGAEVTYKRNLKTAYQSWYVPFDYTLTAEDVEAMRFLDIFNLDVDEQTGKAKNVVGRVMTAGETVKANKPYMVRATVNEGQYTFETTGLKKTEEKAIWCETTSLRYTFGGIYNAVSLSTNPFYALSSGGAFEYWDESGVVQNAFGFVMVIMDKNNGFAPINPHVSTTNLARKINLRIIGGDFDDDDATGIRGVQSAEIVAGAKIYDVAGRQLNSMSKSGLYIVNGKKIYKK